MSRSGPAPAAAGVLQLLAVVRYADTVTWSAARSWLYVLYLVTLVAVGVYGWLTPPVTALDKFRGEYVRISVGDRGPRDPTLSIRRVVPNLASKVLADTRDFYVNLLGFQVVMDMGWIVTVASPSNATAQISFAADGITSESDAPVLTVEVADVDAVHAKALAEDLEISLSLRDEEWGVRRFFVRDPDGRVVNVMSQPSMAD